MKNWFYFRLYLLFFYISLCQFSLYPQIENKLTEAAIDPPLFSNQHGFYNNPFDLVISSILPSAKIKYTTDASDPINSSTAIIIDAPCTINITPDISYGVRGKSPGVVIRACVLSTENIYSQSVTQTYLFLDKIGELSPDRVKPGTGWPNPATTGMQTYDYGMDPNVLNDSRYKDLVKPALLAIPTISLVTDLKNLFSPDSGIYANAYQDGILWEKPASIELLNPDGGDGFQINAGIRIRGGASRSGTNRKHAFRLFFKGEYGDSKLKFPLFGAEGVKEFDKIDLRCGQNYSWAFPDHQGEYHTFTRDVFSRDLQHQMGQPYTRSRYYHLFIDGYYWGLYQTQERSEAKYAVSYFGGSEENYDVIKTNDAWPPSIEVTDGNIDAYKALWNSCVTGYETNENYFKVQGLNSDGTPNPLYKKLVDIDNLIDYMLIIFFTGNFDAPITMWSNNKNPRNFYCIYDRTQNEGFRFWVHDAEHSIRTTAGEHPNAIGTYENRVKIGNLSSTDQFRMYVDDFNNFHPQWLHFKLSSNKEYKIRFADRVYKHFFNNGAIVPEKTKAIFSERARQIEKAIIAESARWGDTYHHPARNKIDDWQPAIDDIMNNYFPVRPAIVLNQLKGVSLYPSISAPVYLNNNQQLKDETMDTQPGFKLVIQKADAMNGVIYYTVDNKDPRAIGGNTSSSAILGNSSDTLTINSTTVIKSRVKNGSVWSALHEIILFVNSDTKNVKITEIHYHPSANDTIDGDEYEFLELKNVSETPVNLSQVSFINGITYTFPVGTIINPKSFIVLASNRNEFNNRYGFYPFAEYAGQLSNSGEIITMTTADGDTIINLNYSDKTPWPETPDGSGYSLVPKEINPTGNMSEPFNWRASIETNGSPRRDDELLSIDDKWQKSATDFSLAQNYPNPFNAGTTICYTLNTDCKVRIMVYDILGSEIGILVNSAQNAGRHEVKFNSDELESGVYFYTVAANNSLLSGKMILLK